MSHVLVLFASRAHRVVAAIVVDGHDDNPRVGNGPKHWIELKKR